MSILEDDGGNIWLGTEGGVSRYDGRSFINFTEKEGLANNSVLNILQDDQKNIWLGTRKGLSKITKTQLSKLTGTDNNFYSVGEGFFYNYGYDDGFLGLNCRRNSVAQDGKGNIWWGTEGATCYNPKKDITDTSAPVVQIKGIGLFGEEIAWDKLGAVQLDSTAKEIVTGKINDTTLGNGVLLKDIRYDGITKWNSLPENLSLPYDNNNLTISFIGIHMQSRNHIKYQYKLEGIDKDWSSITARTEAPYGNLPPGNFKFNVKAMNQSGVWSESFEFKFEVRPPWWQTLWFRVFVVLVILGSVIFFIKWRERKLVSEKEILEETVKVRTHEIAEKQKEILDSIRYAKRIQTAQLPTEKYITNNINKLKKD